MLFSIGYSTRTLPEFLHELRRRRIGQLWDVRSSPWSRNAPFNAPQIERWAELAGIHYRRCGTVLGGMAHIGLDDPRYIDALDALLSAASREPLAFMCSEGDPAHCHRTWDIGASLLLHHGAVTRNILRDGREESVAETLTRVPPSRFKPFIRAMLDACRDPFSSI